MPGSEEIPDEGAASLEVGLSVLDEHETDGTDRQQLELGQPSADPDDSFAFLGISPETMANTISALNNADKDCNFEKVPAGRRPERPILPRQRSRAVDKLMNSSDCGISDGMFWACSSQGQAPPTPVPCPAACAATASRGPRMREPVASRGGLSVPQLPDSSYERSNVKMGLLRDRLYCFLPKVKSDERRQEGVVEVIDAEYGWRHAHVGALFVHVDVLYDLMEGLPAAFVWKVRQLQNKLAAAAKSSQQQASPFATLGKIVGWGESAKKEVKQPETPAAEPQLQLLLSKCVVALSSDLTHVEVHHVHEVHLVPLAHVSDVSAGVCGGSALDEWCVIMSLLDGQRVSLRFARRRQVAPFVAVVLALVHLMRDVAPVVCQPPPSDGVVSWRPATARGEHREKDFDETSEKESGCSTACYKDDLDTESKQPGVWKRPGTVQARVVEVSHFWDQEINSPVEEWV